MIVLSLREIQLKELELLCWFDELCEKNGLYYTLAGGTLLGAIRHKGFIPWDDDIDVLMPRPDYDRLLSMTDIDKEMLPDYVQFNSWKNTNGGEPVPYIKMNNTNVYIDDQYSVTDKYLWIDVFPMDGCPESEQELKTFYHKIMSFRHVLTLKNAKLGRGKNIAKKLLKPFIRLALLPFSMETLCRKYDKFVKTYPFEGTGSIAGMAWGYGPQEKVSRKAWMKPVKVQFEGHAFNAPSNYHEYLTNLYGDYMQLPPEDQRQTRHDVTVYMKEKQV